jgi:hypothetical protein
MTKCRSIGLAVLAMVCGASLTGCITATSDPSNGYPIFEREQTAEDHLPDSFDELSLEEYDLESSRYSGSHEDVDYYLIRMNDSNERTGFCLAIAAEVNPMIGCGGSGGGSIGGSGVRTAEFMPEPAVSTEGWVSVSDNVRVSAN